MHVVVLGAGLAGLAATYELARAGARVTLIEKETLPGGMASSWRVGPYWLDFGPHRFHTRDQELIRHFYEVLDDEVVRRERKSRILLGTKYFDYPLKAMNVLKGLPTRLLAKALLDYLWVRIRQIFRPIPDDHFENWVIARFGRTLYDLFFGTYTSKAWGIPCTEISADWAAQRISQANLFDVIKKTLNPPREGEVRSLVTEFWYPAEGGIGQVARKYAEKARRAGATIHLGAPVKRIVIRDGRVEGVEFELHGETQALACDRVINTIPLPIALRAFDPGIAPEVEQAIAALRYIGIVFIYLAVKRPMVVPDHWIYLPSHELTIHRISEFKNFSDAAAPGDSTILCCEITCHPGKGHWNLTLEEGARIAEEDLVRVGLLEPGEATPIEIAKLPHAYPVYDLEYKDRLAVLQLAAEGIENFFTTGRQGLFRYNNMDHSMTMGRRMARTLLEEDDAGAESVATEQEYFG